MASTCRINHLTRSSTNARTRLTTGISRRRKESPGFHRERCRATSANVGLACEISTHQQAASSSEYLSMVSSTGGEIHWRSLQHVRAGRRQQRPGSDWPVSTCTATGHRLARARAEPFHQAKLAQRTLATQNSQRTSSPPRPQAHPRHRRSLAGRDISPLAACIVAEPTCPS